MNNKDLQISKIKEIYPNSADVFKLDAGGYIHDTYVVLNKNNDKFICRFSPKNMALHNLYVSKLLTSYDIRVPQVSLYKSGKEYCETYPFIEGKTFYERITEGMPKEKQLDVYKQMFDIACRITKIPYDCKNRPGVTLTYKIASIFFNSLNLSDCALCHTDLHAKNVVLDEHDNLFALLDLDSVFPEYMAFAMVTLIKDAQTQGCDITEIIKLCEEHYVLPKLMGIETQTKIYSKIKGAAKSVLSDKIIKQILKIRVR